MEKEILKKKPSFLKRFLMGIVFLVSFAVSKVIVTTALDYFTLPPKVQPFTWEAQSYKDLKFESPLPMKLEVVSMSKLPKEAQELIISMEGYTATDRSINLSVQTIVYKEGINPNLEGAVKGGISASIKSMNASYTPETTITSYNKNGIEGMVGSYDLSIRNNIIHFRNLVFLQGLKLYNVLFIYSDNRATEADVARFFDSVRISKPVQAQNNGEVTQ